MLGAFIILIGLSLSSGILLDQGLSKNVGGLLHHDDIYFTFSKVLPNKRSSHSLTQKLLSLQFNTQGKFELVLDRKNGLVVIEDGFEGDVHRQEISTPSIRPKSIVKSILLELLQEGKIANVYVNCELVGSATIKHTPKSMATSGNIKVYRDPMNEVNADWSTNVEELLTKQGCSDIENFQAQSNEIYTYRRGDIPITSHDQKASVLVNSLSELVETIKELQVEIQTQRQETTMLREALMDCEMCKPGRRFGR